MIEMDKIGGFSRAISTIASHMGRYDMDNLEVIFEHTMLVDILDFQKAFAPALFTTVDLNPAPVGSLESIAKTGGYACRLPRL